MAAAHRPDRRHRQRQEHGRAAICGARRARDRCGRRSPAKSSTPGTALLERLLERFGPRHWQRFGEPLRRADGSLDRALLRRWCSMTPRERHALEALLHPAIRARTEELALQQAGGPYQIHVVPLLVENHARGRFDRVLVVDCPEALQLRAPASTRRHRAASRRRPCSLRRRAAPARLAAADDVIVNDAGTGGACAQVAALDQKYRELAARRASLADHCVASGRLRAPTRSSTIG